MSTPGAGWFADPMQRHQLRYWSGQEWTAHVADNGQVAVDALGQPNAPQYQPQAQYQPQTPFQQPQMQPPQMQSSQMQSSQMQSQGWSSAPAISSAEPGAAASSVGRVTLGAAVVSGVGAIVDWMGRGGVTANGFDVPAVFLLDYETDSEFDNPGLAVGHLVTVLAIALLAAAFARQPMRRTIALVVGIGLMVVAALFLLQLQRGVSEFGDTLFDYLQLGPFAVIAGGVMAVVARGR